MRWPFMMVRILFLCLNLHLPTDIKIFEFHLNEVSRNLTLQEEKRKKVVRKFKVRKKFKRERILKKYYSTKAKDHRFSDQRKLRRMYRNS
jgi:hypothetical protein